jgi:hypothetical protein
MSRTLRYHRSARHFSSRLPTRVVAVAVGTGLLLLNASLVLGPVLGLAGAVAPANSLLDVHAASVGVVVVLGFLAAGLCVLGAYVARRRVLTWGLVVLAWAISLLACLWPVIAGAEATVHRIQDVLPWVHALVRSVSGVRSA